MKTLSVFCLLISFATVLIAQKQTFDLISYIPPPGGGWTKEEKKNVLVFSKVKILKRGARWAYIKVPSVKEILKPICKVSGMNWR